MKLDIGCGKGKQPGFIGVDAIAFEGVDVVHDVRITPWPWADGEVEYIHCSHFIEHLSREEWVPFFNEAYRVLKVGGQMHCITPHWTHACAYGDPTHKSFLSEWVVQYLNKQWREANAPHVGYTCDFDWGSGASFDEWLWTRAQEVKEFATRRYVNSCRDLIFTLTKRPPS
jgi:predicted SAM-dependent methyltransferase